MKLELTRAGEAYGLPRSAVIAGTALAALGIVVAVLGSRFAGPVTCPFRLVTGLPCPTCGLVRTAGYLLRGEFVAAFRLNPMDAMTMLVGVPTAVGLWVANRSGGWTVRVHSSRRERFWMWSGVVAAFAANWLYVLISGV